MVVRQIVVHVVDYGREHLLMRYRDPVTKKQVAKTTGKADRQAAEKVAAVWESELRKNPPAAVSGRKKWADFKTAYEEQHLLGLADSTDLKVSGIFRAVERILKPTYLDDLTSGKLSELQASLRKSGMAETTIAGYMAHIGSALRWAHDLGMLKEVPKIPKVKRAKSGTSMKGRPLTEAEFDLLLAAVPLVAGAEDAPAWQFYLRGLWTSGLRLEESLELYWDRRDRLCIDTNHGRHPMLHIPAELEKGGKDRLMPLAPEFAILLEGTDPSERTGRVFKLPRKRKHSRRTRFTKGWVSNTVTDFGEKAGIVSDARTGKFASAHDLRRSFAERWSLRVMPAVLQQMMRHEDITTTLKFYVGRNAQLAADVLWEAHAKASGGNILSNTD